MRLDIEDYWGVLEVLARYGHLVDERDWSGLGAVFTPDAVFDCSALGLGVFDGLEALRQGFATMRHPVSHHSTNVLVEAAEDASAVAHSKWIVTLVGGSTAAGEYHDRLVRTADGWRISRRTLRPRLPRGDSM